MPSFPTRYHLPPDIISYAAWFYCKFNLSHHDIEDLLAERGVTDTRGSIPLCCNKCGALYARRSKRSHQGYGDTSFIDAVFVKIIGKQRYLCRAVDQDGNVIDVYLLAKRDVAAVNRFFQTPVTIQWH